MQVHVFLNCMCIALCVCLGVFLLLSICEGWRTAGRSLFSPSIMWVSGIKSESSNLVANALVH